MIGDSRVGNQIEMGEQISISKNLKSEQNSNMLIAANRAPLNQYSQSQQYNKYNIPSASQIPKFRGISANQNQAQNAEGLHPPSERSEQANFRILGKISEDEKIEIIQTGF